VSMLKSKCRTRKILLHAGYLIFLCVIFGFSFVVIISQDVALQSEIFFGAMNQTNLSDCDSVLICPGEDLTYEVRWWMFKIGQIKVKTLESKSVDNKTRHSAAVFIDSYNGVPFVDLHAIDYSEMDSAFFSHGFRAIEKKNDKWLVENSHFDYQNKVMIIEKTWQKDLESAPSATPEYDTVALDHSMYLDGLSILYYARAHVRSNIALKVPSIVYAKKGSISFYLSNNKTTEEIDAVGKPIRVVQFEGKADFDGIFGFTGDFKGWFTDDVAAIPIKAEMKVILGNITIELKKWERRGWTPPLENKN
jgi:hypothetical protein